jgi:YD repeat-containing protein
LYDENGNVTDTIYYHYDQSGLLISESDAQGQTTREYVYLNGIPVAQIDIDSQARKPGSAG